MKNVIFCRVSNYPYMVVIQGDDYINQFEKFSEMQARESYIIARIRCDDDQLNSYLRGIKKYGQHNYFLSDDELFDILSEKHKEIGEVVSLIRKKIIETGISLNQLFMGIKYNNTVPLHKITEFLYGLSGRKLTGGEIYDLYTKSTDQPHLSKRAFGLQVTANGYKSKITTRGRKTGRYYCL